MGSKWAAPSSFEKLAKSASEKPEEQVLFEEANEELAVHETGRVCGKKMAIRSRSAS